MKILDRTFGDPALDLAFDEALLDWCEGGFETQILRFWEPTRHFVVLGYSNKAETEILGDACRADGTPVFRRCSGGGTVLQGPGCLNYSLIFNIQADSRHKTTSATNAFVMESHRRALEPLLKDRVTVEGHTDLALGGMKFSGNAQRRKKTHVLFHGTFLMSMDLAKMERCLAMPSLQPAYRNQRPHGKFVTNVNLPRELLKKTLADCWGAEAPLQAAPESEARRLAEKVYSRPEWIFKF